MKKRLKDIVIAILTGSAVGGILYFIPMAHEYMSRRISDWSIGVIYTTLATIAFVYFSRKRW